MKKEIVLPALEEIIAINAQLTGERQILNKSSLEFIYDKIRHLKNRYKKVELAISLIAAVLFYEIITQHPFIDGNKRTAVETMKYFLRLNNYKLNLPYNHLVYLALKSANREISINQLKKIFLKHLIYKI